jgi:hypothetical protein
MGFRSQKRKDRKSVVGPPRTEGTADGALFHEILVAEDMMSDYL